MKMLFKGNSSRLELLIEKIQSTKELPETSKIDETSRMEEPYECSVCFLTFSRSAALDEHMQTHTDQLQFTCSYCPRLFKHKRSRDRHTKLHTGDKKYKCQQCDSAFSRSDHLKIHMKTHDSRKPYKCGTCNRGYNTAAALSSHQQSHLKQESRSGSRTSRGSTPSPGLFRCNQCTDSFTKQELLQEHLISYHNDEDAPIRTPDRISVEPKSQHDELKIICMYCSKEFPSLESMYHHVSITHRDFQNGVTSALSTQSSSLQSSPKNELCQNGTPTYACDKCTMQFESVQNLKDHLNMIHWRPILTNNLKEYNLNRAKTAGMDKSYSPFQTHPTDLSRKKCKDDYFDASAKKRKIDQHSPSMTSPYDANDKPCICSCCYAQLPNFKSFLNHMETHMASSNTSFLGFCPFCGEPGRDPVSFTNHIFGHAIAQVPGTCCYVCKKSFEHLDDLQKHFAEIHVIPIYKCSICNEIFDSKLTMQMHFTTKHNEECHHFKCYLCTNQIFHDRLSAELHISMKHYHQFVPSVNTANQSLLTSQYQVELDKRLRDFGFLFQCTFCQECFKDQYSQYIHILKEHNDTKEGEKYLLETALNQRQTPSTSPSFLFSKSVASPDNVNKFDVKNAKSLTCDICNRSDITTEADLIAHKKIQHAKSKIRSVSLQCAYCNEYCKSRNDLENHMKSHQVNCGKGKHKCNICDEVFSSSLILADHKLTHCKIVDGNNCLQCKAVLSDEKLFYSHQLQHSNGPIRPNSQISLPANCIICCQTLQTEVEIKLHAKFHLKHLTKEFVCGICNKLCDNQNYTVVDGMSEQSRNKFTVTICKDCNRKKEGTPNISQENMKNKENEIYLQCPQYIRDNEVQDQVNLHMTSEISSNLECRLCKQIFPSPSKLQVHLIEHNFYGMNQYNCYVCSSVFTAASGLQNHIVGHGLQSKPYECSHCQMKFFFRSELDNHRFIHLNSPQQKCETPKSHLQSNGTDLYENRSSPQYKTCKYCSSSYLNNSFFTEHLTQCPFRVDLKQECYDVDIESTIKKEVADSSQEFINEEQ